MPQVSEEANVAVSGFSISTTQAHSRGMALGSWCFGCVAQALETGHLSLQLPGGYHLWSCSESLRLITDQDVCLGGFTFIVQ